MYKLILFFLGIILLCSCQTSTDNQKKVLIDSLSEQLKVLAERIPEDKVPRSYKEETGYQMVGKDDWTSGFPAGTFWYMYEETGDEYWKEQAVKNTVKLEGFQFNTGTHDLGFMVNNSYGQAYRLTVDPEYKKVVLQAAESLITRFNPTVGSIKSWDWNDKWQFPVIVDNMMNLEMLFWASKETGDSKYRDVAITHANTTLKNHFRENMSSYHVVDYDTLTGEVLSKVTYQGFSDESSWGRGQAWGLYGFTMCYRETQNPEYLEAAQKIADYIIRNLPEDYVSYWDYNDPDVPNTERDASAAAVTASALYELSSFATDGSNYLDIAEKITDSLTSVKYRATNGENGGFLLMHSVGNKPGNSEIDVAMNYADYYYVEALKRKFESINKK
ncbi:MAG: glycoside hydrolase family 88 protein [Prolixibacteraceae bacterium]|nr:glycoside hydrolase family 88 protein [Prolixibacteraceae bacterium]